MNKQAVLDDLPVEERRWEKLPTEEQAVTKDRQDRPLQQDWADNDANNSLVPAEQHPIEDRYNTHDASFRRHYQLNYAGNAHPYEEFYAPAYRFGFELSEQNPATRWASMQRAAQAHWQTHHPSAWPEVAEAVRYGWVEQRRPDTLRVHHYDEFDVYRPGFERHYQDALHDADYSFAHYEPAYLYGYHLAAEPDYTHPQVWDELEPEVRRYYETEYSTGALPWERYRDAVRHAWHEVRSTVA